MKTHIERFRLKEQAIDEKWGDLIQFTIGVATVCACIAIFILALQIRAETHKTDEQAKKTALQSWIQCKRTRKFAPVYYALLTTLPEFTPELRQEFADTLPKRCPKPPEVKDGH